MTGPVVERTGRLGRLPGGIPRLSRPGLVFLLGTPALTMRSNLRIDGEDGGGEDNLSMGERVTDSGECERRFPMSSGTGGVVVAAERGGD